MGASGDELALAEEIEPNFALLGTVDDLSASVLRYERDAVSQALSLFRGSGIVFELADGRNASSAILLKDFDALLGVAVAAFDQLPASSRQGADPLVHATMALQLVAQLQQLRRFVPLRPDQLRAWTLSIEQNSIGLARAAHAMSLGGSQILSDAVAHRYRVQRSQLGAQRARTKKDELKRSVLQEAARIVTTNPTLSNEELARKLQDRHCPKRSLRTVQGWVREWRRANLIPQATSI